MKKKPHYLKVLISKEAIIIKLECTLRDVKYDPSNVIGINWFDVFIEDGDKETVSKVFNDLFNDKTEEWKTFENDIRCMDGSHKLMDFTNEIVTVDGIKYLSSFGIEHLDNL